MRTSIRNFFVTGLMTLCLLFVPLKGLTQVPSDDPAARKAKAEADLKELEAMLKKAELDAKEFDNLQKQIEAMRGKVSVKTLNVENEISAMESLNFIARSIWCELPNGDIDAIWIGSDAVRQSLTEYDLLLRQLNAYDNAYTDFWRTLGGYPEPSRFAPLTAIAIASSVLSAVKTDLAFEGGSATIGKDMVTSSFAKNKPVGTEVYVADRIFPTNTESSQFLTKLKSIQDNYWKVRYSLDTLLRIETTIRNLEAARGKLRTASDEEAKKLLAQIKSLETEYSELQLRPIERIMDDNMILLYIGGVKRLNSAVEKLSIYVGLPLEETLDTKSVTNLRNLMRAELIKKSFTAKHFWIDFSDLKAGGTVRTQNNIFNGLFRPDRLVTFSGGSGIAFTITDSDGKIRWSGVKTYYRPFVTHKELSSSSNSPAECNCKPTPTPSPSPSPTCSMRGT